MLDPASWFRLVLLVGVIHALGVGASLWWLLARLPPSQIAPEGIFATSFLGVASVFIPFLAYAADSRTLLERYPSENGAEWQAVGGLVGLSIFLVLLHLVVCIRSGLPQSWLLVYKLLFPPLIVGGLGAAAGIAVSLVVHFALTKGGST